MSLVRLGRMKIRWCKECNVPLIGMRCSVCGSEGFAVNMTPPGDARPAFDFDKRMIRELADRQFGEGCGELLVPEDKIVLLNRAPAEDRLDEIIVDGVVVGALKYEIFGKKPGLRVSLRIDGAQRILPRLEKSWIVVDKGAVEPILKSANALAVGINEIAEGIEAGDEVVVLSPDRKVIAVGRAMMDAGEMRAAERGVGIKVRSRLGETENILPSGQTWEDVLKANRNSLERNLKKATEFIKRVVEEENLPLIVSYSGGKDSLASLLLTLDAGLKPRMLFLNTGIELPETVENARNVAEKYGLELDVVDADDAFWKGLEVFGPPAKDYRWCCKACKLGPITRFIKEGYDGALISVIGQREYESEARARKGKRWENPWVIGQKGISPIQHWTALEVWLYLFMKNANYNPWYERGMYRIGCYPCPSADIGDAEVLKRAFEGYRRWEKYLENYAREKGLGKEWVEYGLWRWKRAPGWIKSRGFDVPGFARGKGGISFEGKDILKPSKPLNMERVREFLKIIGKWEEKNGKLTVDGICEISESSIKIFDEGDKAAVINILEQSAKCIGCGVCVGRCPKAAIKIIDGKAHVNPDICVSCRKCLDGPCPARDFKPADI